MLFPEKMDRIRIVIEPEYSDRVMEQIGKTGVMHIDTQQRHQTYAAEGKQLKILLSKIQKLMKQLGVESRKRAIATVPDIAAAAALAEETLLEVSSDVDSVVAHLKRFEEESEHFDRADEVKKALAEELDLARLSEELHTIRMHVGVAGMEEAELLRLSCMQRGLMTLIRPLYQQSSAIALFYEEEDEGEVLGTFGTFNVSLIKPEYLSEKQYGRWRERHEALLDEKSALASRYAEPLQKVETHLLAILALADAKAALKEVKNGVELQGWIPHKRAKLFREGLEHATVTFLEREGEAPVLLETPKALKPFEKLIRNFSHPRYGEINPVIPFAFTFLLLFGIMFGDVGHGAILALLGWIAKRYSAHYADLGQVYFLSGISSTIFGFLYGSVFGVHHLLPHLLFTPIENIESTILFSIAIGIAIITLSFVMHILTSIKRREPALLFVSEGSLLWLLVYWFTIGIFVKAVVQQLDITNEVMILSVLLLVIFVQMVRRRAQKAQAVIDLLREFMDTITNTISFLRVGAFALAHGALFMAVFSIARLISETHGESFFYWLSIIIGNIVIIVLEGIVVTIQTLRLEYYEFFKRFYKGGGVPYRPYSVGGEDED